MRQRLMPGLSSRASGAPYLCHYVFSGTGEQARRPADALERIPVWAVRDSPRQGGLREALDLSREGLDMGIRPKVVAIGRATPLATVSRALSRATARPNRSYRKNSPTWHEKPGRTSPPVISSASARMRTFRREQ